MLALKRDGLDRLTAFIAENRAEILEQWINLQLKDAGRKRELMPEGEVREHSRQFLDALSAALAEKAPEDIQAPAWEPVHSLLTTFSSSRALQGFSPSETATFVFSLKEPIFAMLLDRGRRQDGGPIDEVWAAGAVLDKLGLFTTEVYQRSREGVIARQQQELLELSTPVVTLLDGVVALPLIGTLDSARTQVVMEALLHRIVDTGAAIAIIDITGVPTVDTLVAQYLLKTVAAARLMGADCIISGIRPQIAQTIVHLGVQLNVATKASLADALLLALQRTGQTIRRIEERR
jgi:rsbT co-antagonist protein RsbR